MILSHLCVLFLKSGGHLKEDPKLGNAGKKGNWMLKNTNLQVGNAKKSDQGEQKWKNSAK